MRLSELDVFNLRNLTEIHMECAPGLNIISGKNAAGKTAILEAIHMLARANSFRTPRINDVIQYGKQQLTISARLNDGHNSNVITGIEKSRYSTRIRFNGNNVSKRSEQARNLPVITVSPESHRLLNGAPRERRHWLDWSMFHVEPGYMEHWRTYHHALRHRNALLRQQGQQTHFNAWEETLAASGAMLRQARNNYINRINRRVIETAAGCIEGICINLRTEDQDPETFRDNLKKQRPSDIMLGYTQQGPHREDVLFNINGRVAGKTLSRGEGKLFILFLVIAQAHEHEQLNQKPVLLIDDLSAELDAIARGKILDQLKYQGLQAFITTTDPVSLDASAKTCKRFHVEHGNITGLTV